MVPITSMAKKPLITIITVTLNSVKYIEDCVQSVLAQDYDHIEHVIIDGQSKDGTVEILQKYAGLYPQRIRFISEKDQGPGDAWNKGLRLAQGDILGWLGGDDMYEPDAVSCVVNYFQSHGNVVFVYGALNIIDSRGNVMGVDYPKKLSLHDIIHQKQTLPTVSSFYKKEVIKTVGEFDRLGNDLDFFIRVLKNFPAHYVGKIISNLRVHPDSQTNSHDVPKRKMWLKEWCHTSRKHGGSCLSGYCIKYYIFIVFGWALPVWNFVYYSYRKMIKK